MKTIMSLNKTQGVTLAIALIMLLLLTIIGVAAMQTTLFEQKMSANSQDKELSFQAAESALREAENWVLTQTVQPVPVNHCAAYPCAEILSTTVYPEQQSAAWWAANSALFTTGALSNINTAPRYKIEFYRFVPDTPTVGKGVPTGSYYYRITARGTGATDSATTVLQTSLARRY